MNDFFRGLMIGALAGLATGSIATYVAYSLWVGRLLRGLVSDTRRMLERTAPPAERR